MGIIDRLHRATDQVGAAIVKASTPVPVIIPNSNLGFADTPADVQAAMDAAGMNSTARLGPGRPMNPAFGYNEEPRQFDYRVGQNINNRPRQTEKVAFRTLRTLVETYDIAQLCIFHRIASVRGLDWNIVADRGYERVDLDAQIAHVRKLLTKPDGSTPFDSWLAMWLYDILAFDAGCLYRQRDGLGNVAGLEVIDGTTIAPLIDQYGRTPGDAPAYVQFVQGLGTIDLDVQHLIYLPYQPISNSLYGRAPIETVLLNANTDIRFQAYLMQRFTEGNIPSMLAMAPESWTPDQIIEFQTTWDAWMKGDQSVKSQIKWIPGGTKVQETHEADAAYNEQLADRLLRKTASAYHVPPTDLGWTDKSNRSTAESQDSVGERIGDRPLTSYINGIFTRFIQEDLGFPLRFEFMMDTEDIDAVAQAQADKAYVDMGAVSASWVAAERFGIEDAPGERVPRFIMTTKGPVPVSNLFASSTVIDPATEAPEADSVFPAVQEHTLDVLPSVEQTGSAAVDAAAPAAAAKAELTTFRKYLDRRAARGRGWRDFVFKSVPAGLARELNRAGRSELAKADGEVNVAGLCVYAEDTGRVLMLQRALDDADPNAGLWEFPGGHLEGAEEPIDAACREWQEETGCRLPDGVTLVSHWDAGNYQGFIVTVPAEAAVPCRIGSPVVLNPDDPDGDNVETVAWIDPATLAGWAALRPELAASLPDVFAALAVTGIAKGYGAAFAQRVLALYDAWELDDYVFVEAIDAVVDDPDLSDREALVLADQRLTADEAAPASALTSGRLSQVTAAAERYAAGLLKGGDADPFVRKGWRDMEPKTPQHRYDVALTDYYAPLIQAGLRAWVNGLPLDAVAGPVAKADGANYAGGLPVQPGYAHPQLPLGDLYADSYTAGEHAGAEQLAGHVTTIAGVSPAATAVNWDAWEPGNLTAAGMTADGGLAELLDTAGITIRGIEGGLLDEVGDTLAAGLAEGLSVRSIRNTLLDSIGGLFRAERIAHTEATRAVTAGSFAVYAGNGVTEWDLIASDGACPICLAAEAANPHPMSDDAAKPPLHPFCRCASAPRADSITAGRNT